MIFMLLSSFGIIFVSSVVFFEIKRKRLSNKFKHIPSASEFIGSLYTVRMNSITGNPKLKRHNGIIKPLRRFQS